MPLEQPVPIKPILELKQGLPKFLDGVEGPHPQQMPLQRADAALGYPGALRGPDKARARFDPQEPQFLLERMAHVLGAEVAQARRSRRGEAGSRV